MISDCWTVRSGVNMLSGHSSEPQTRKWCRAKPQLSQHSVWCVFSACHMFVCCMCTHVYMRDSRLSAMLVCPSGTDPLVSGLCRALWSSWLLTRLSTARYRYWYCSWGGKTQLQHCEEITVLMSKRSIYMFHRYLVSMLTSLPQFLFSLEEYLVCVFECQYLLYH